jgi:hypothetical protein
MDVDEALRSVERCLEKPGKSQGGLAVLEVSDSAISRMLQGDRRIQTAELPKVAAYLEEPIPETASARGSIGLREARH